MTRSFLIRKTIEKTKSGMDLDKSEQGKPLFMPERAQRLASFPLLKLGPDLCDFFLYILLIRIHIPPRLIKPCFSFFFR